MSVLEGLVAPFRHAFMIRAAVASILVGGVCSVVGTFVVLRSMAFLGDAIAHSVLPGVATGMLVSGRGDRRGLFWWALGTSVLVALGVGWVGRRGRIREETAIGIVFAGAFALGIALLSRVRGFAVDLVHVLFGNVLGVSTGDLVLIAAFGAGVLFLIVLFYKELLLVSFDPTLAATLRLPVWAYHSLILILVAVTVVVSLQVVGLALTLALLVAPPATAMLFVRRVPSTMLVGAAVGAASGVVGLYVSYYADIAPGATIVLVAIAAFLVGLLVSPRSRRRFARPRRP